MERRPLDDRLHPGPEPVHRLVSLYCVITEKIPDRLTEVLTVLVKCLKQYHIVFSSQYSLMLYFKNSVGKRGNDSQRDFIEMK